MLNQIKTTSQKALYILFISLSLSLLAACSPHPATGSWVSSSDNPANYSKILIHFEPKLEIYTTGSDKPVHYCGWSAISKKIIEMGCMSSDEQEIMDKFQLNIISEAKAELIENGKVVASFDLVDE